MTDIDIPEALELVIRGREGLPVAYACPKCGCLFTIHKKEEAAARARKKEEAAKHCHRFCACGNPLDPHWLRCHACIAQEDHDKEEACFQKAAKLNSDEYNDPVYWEGHTGGLGDGYFTGVDEVLEYCADEAVAPPEYVWACSAKAFKLDAHAFLEREVEKQELFEGAFDQIGQTRIDSMQAYFNEWTASLDLTSWEVDYSRAVFVPSNDRPDSSEN